MFPEGKAYINNCRKCGAPVILAYCGGLKAPLHTWSIPYRHASVLSVYWGVVYRVWPDYFTKYHDRTQPASFFVATWRYPSSRPTQGRLYIRHLCPILGPWSRQFPKAKPVVPSDVVKQFH